MPLEVFNTLTNKKEPFEPAEPGKVRMYVCGVTVYDHSHIGHARCYVAFDIVYRYFRARGDEVTYVRNFTDVDDKIIKRANDEGVAFTAITEKYIALYHEEMAALGNLSPDTEPRVSEHLDEIIETIERIIEAGKGYVADGDVFFSVRDLPSYGELSGRSLDDMRAGERVEVDARKRDPMDFALWKSAKPGEPAWPSPWGEGRPGWHIECTVMSTKYLGENFDMHGGGRDLIFPHHENEIAQARACGAPGLARVWLHNGFVNIDKEKMSKSLGNIRSLADLIREYHPEALRLFLLGTHYRHPINFSTERLAESTERVGYFYETLKEARAVTDATELDDAGRKILDEATAALADDFSTPGALAAMSEAFTEANRLIQLKKKKDAERKKAGLGAFLALVEQISAYLGLWESDPAEVLAGIRDRAVARAGIDAGEVERLIEERRASRGAKDFAKADEIRDKLDAMGVEIKDSPEGTEWSVRAEAGADD